MRRGTVQGAAGSVGLCAVQLARRAGARVIGTIRSSSDETVARRAGAHEVILAGEDLRARMKSIAPGGVDHVVEVAFGANLDTDVELLTLRGSIGAYATDQQLPKIPFWPMVFKNIRVFFLGSDDFTSEEKAAAVRDLNLALDDGWSGFEIAERVPLSEIARAHELVERPRKPGRVVVVV